MKNPRLASVFDNMKVNAFLLKLDKEAKAKDTEVFTKKKLSHRVHHSGTHGWLDKANLPEETKVKMLMLVDRVMNGYRMRANERKFMQTQEYDDAQHACDVVSGEYPKLLASTAKGLFVASGLIQAGNFECHSTRAGIEKQPVYVEDEKGFTASDKCGNHFFVTVEQVEVYYSLINQ